MLVKLAPNPVEGNPGPFIKGSDTENEFHADPDPGPSTSLAHVFQRDGWTRLPGS